MVAEIKIEIDLDELVIADRFNGGAMDLGDGQEMIYLLCVGGYKRTGNKHDDRAPDMVYGMTLNDLSTIVARLLRAVTGAGEGKRMMRLLAPKLGMDPATINLINDVVDERRGNG